MATTKAPTSTTQTGTHTANLSELAKDLRSSATTFEAFVTTLAQKTAKLEWEGGAADTFRADVKTQQSMLSRAIDLCRQLANRIDTLVEDAQRHEAQLRREEDQLVATMRKEIADAEQVAKASHESVATLLAQDPTFAKALTQQGQTYTALQHDLSSLGGI